MKNKLLKTLTCFASISAIGSTIAITSTSCGCSNIVLKILPYEVYDIDETTNVLKGFKDDFLSNPHSKIYQDKFKSCHTMQIPAYVTSIDAEAFYNDSTTTIPTFIKNLTFADNSNCTSIGGSAFQDSPLTSVDFSNANSLEKIESDVFYCCSELNSITFPSSLESIGDFTFGNCSSLTSVDLSSCNGLTTINQGVFWNCSNLITVSLPSSLATIGAIAFYFCSSLDSIVFPDNLSSIGESAFEHCSKLSSVTFPSSLTTIPNRAFSYCSSLTSVTLPNSLTSIGGSAFLYCSSLRYIAWNLPDKYIDNISFEYSVFMDISSSGTVESLNASIASSQDLLNWIKDKTRPFISWDNWRAAD